MKKIVMPQTKSLTLQIHDFTRGIDNETAENVIDYGYAVKSYNMSFNNGVLSQGLGIKDLTLPVSKTDESTFLQTYVDPEAQTPYYPHYLWWYKIYDPIFKTREDKICFTDFSGYIRYVKIFSLLPQYRTCETPAVLTGRPCTINLHYGENDYTIMSTETEGTYGWRDFYLNSKYENAPKIKTMCEHDGRIYYGLYGEKNYIVGTTNYNISGWVSGTLESTDFVINMHQESGGVNKLISFGGYLYAFQDYEITRISIFTNNSYKTQSIFVSGNKIYPHSISVCGDEIYMLTKGGIYSFDGVNIKKIDAKFNSLFNNCRNDESVSAYSKGIYYLACKLNFNDTEQIGCESSTFINNSLIAYDIANETYSIVRGVDIASLLAVQVYTMDKLVISFNNFYTTHLGEIDLSGKIFNASTDKYWCSPLTDLGYSECKKSIQYVSLVSKYNCDLTIFTDKERKTFKIKGSNLLTKIPVNMIGKQVGFEFSTSEDNVHISNFKMKVNLLNSLTN